MLDVGCWMLDVGESGIKANSSQFSWSLAELGKSLQHLLKIYMNYLDLLYQGPLLLLCLICLYSLFERPVTVTARLLDQGTLPRAKDVSMRHNNIFGFLCA